MVPDHRAQMAEPRDVNGDLCRCCHTMLEICEDRFKRAVQGDPLPHLRPPFQTYGDFRRGNDR
jgi:hypothetical protein